MKKFTATAAVMACAGSLFGANPEKVKLATVIKAYKELPAPNKRIFVDFEKWKPDAALKTPAGQHIARIVLRDAEAIMPLPVCNRVQEGKRLLGVCRQVLIRVNTLAMAWKLTGKEKYARRAIAEMLSAANFTDWNPSHFLDTGEMCIALSVGYACFDSFMSEAERKTIADALWEKGVMVSFKDHPAAKAQKALTWWIKGPNNWSPVCHSGMIAAALIAGNRDPRTAAKVIHRAVKYLPISMKKSYAPNGAYPEGPGYWVYGSEFNCLALGLLEHAFGTDFGLSELPGWSNTGNFISHATGPSGMSFNFSDGGADVSCCLPWFFLENHFPGTIPLTDFVMKKLEESSKIPAAVKYIPTYKMEALQGNRLLPLALFWLKPQKRDAKRKLWYYSGDTAAMPLAMFRTDWSSDAIYLGIKGGGAKYPHAHMDSGSFVIDALGVRWVTDLGMEAYFPLEARGLDLWHSHQSCDRWKVLRLSSDSHNIVRINGAPQLVDGWGKIVKLQTTQGKPMSAKLELASLYKNVKAFERTGALAGDRVTIKDEMTVKAGDKVRFQFCTPAEVESRGNALILQIDGKTMTVTADSEVKWQWAPVDNWRREWDSPNGSAKMVWFEVTAPANGKVKYTVAFIPEKQK